MKVDKTAVAGFFEDLPVLLFVLAGVTTLVVTSTLAAEKLGEQKRQKELNEWARDITDTIVRRVQQSAGPNGLPLVSSMINVSLSDEVPQINHCDFAASVFIVHPLVKPIVCFSSDPEALPKLTGSSQRLMNAIDDQGEVVILKVRTVAW